MRLLAEGAAEAISPDEVILYLLLNLAIIIAAARFMGFVARRIGQPAVIGEITAGILLGPTVLGRINGDWPTDIFPAGVPLEQISSLGLVFFMFLVGLELDLSIIRSQARRAVQISLAGIALPLSLGFALALALYSVNQGGEFHPIEPLDHEVSRYTFALFVGAAMCITAFPILARMLVETGLYRTQVGVTALCAGAVDDVIAWVLLAGVVGIAQEGSPLAAGQAFVLTAIFAGFLATVGRRGLNVLARRYEATGRLTIDQVAAILGGVLLSAYVTELIGVHAIFGAFIFGAVMPKRAGMTHQLTDKIEDFTVIVLLPVFFLVAGLRTDLFTLDSVSLVGWTLLLLAVATLGKFAGCGIASLAGGAPRRESLVIGALMNTRGLTELVILTIGLELGVLSDRTFAMMVVMALATTVIAAPVVNRLMPRELVLAGLARAERPAPAATRILVMAVPGAPLSSLAAFTARLIGERRPAEVLFLRPLPVSRSAEVRSGLAEGELLAQQATAEVEPAVAQLANAGIAARTLAIFSEDPVADAASVVEEQGVDTVVVGWDRSPAERLRWRRLSRRLMSRLAVDVIALADGPGIESATPTLAAGTGPDSAAANILDRLGAERGGAAAEGAELLVVSVSPDWQSSAEFGAAASAAIESHSGPVAVVHGGAAAGAASSPDGWPFRVPTRQRTESAPIPLLAAPNLELLDEWGHPVARYAVAPGTTIGRADGNTVILAMDPLVSRRHAELAPADDGHVLVDNASTNGTLVWRDGDWLPVSRIALRDRDLVIIGANVLRYRAAGGKEVSGGEAPVP